MVAYLDLIAAMRDGHRQLDEFVAEGPRPDPFDGIDWGPIVAATTCPTCGAGGPTLGTDLHTELGKPAIIGGIYEEGDVSAPPPPAQPSYQGGQSCTPYQTTPNASGQRSTKTDPSLPIARTSGSAGSGQPTASSDTDGSTSAEQAAKTPTQRLTDSPMSSPTALSPRNSTSTMFASIPDASDPPTWNPLRAENTPCSEAPSALAMLAKPTANTDTPSMSETPTTGSETTATSAASAASVETLAATPCGKCNGSGWIVIDPIAPMTTAEEIPCDCPPPIEAPDPRGIAFWTCMWCGHTAVDGPTCAKCGHTMDATPYPDDPDPDHLTACLAEARFGLEYARDLIGTILPSLPPSTADTLTTIRAQIERAISVLP